MRSAKLAPAAPHCKALPLAWPQSHS